MKKAIKRLIIPETRSCVESSLFFFYTVLHEIVGFSRKIFRDVFPIPVFAATEFVAPQSSLSRFLRSSAPPLLRIRHHQFSILILNFGLGRKLHYVLCALRVLCGSIES